MKVFVVARDETGDRLTEEDGTPASEEKRAALAILVAAEQFIPGLALMESASGVSLPGQSGGGNPRESTLERLGKYSPLAIYEGDKLNYFRSLPNSQQITVPATGSGSSSGSGIDYGKAFGGGSSSGIDYKSLFGGG